MASIGRMSHADVDALSSMDPVTAALTLREALNRAPAVCAGCGRVCIVVPRCSTNYAGHCECGGVLELVGQ